MDGPSASHTLTEVEQLQALNEVLVYENIGDFSLDDDSFSDNDYTQLVTLGTHVISDSKSNNGSNEEHEQSISKGLGYDMCGPQFDTAELDVMHAFENIFDSSYAAQYR
jgi:hypothetical protein